MPSLISGVVGAILGVVLFVGASSAITSTSAPSNPGNDPVIQYDD
ncbi:MAG: DUF2613 family protein [Nocardioidaceae bacterium]|nr:MAG: DUF2613 family protein [Nocardioidaceae bacterium]